MLYFSNIYVTNTSFRRSSPAFFSDKIEGGGEEKMPKYHYKFAAATSALTQREEEVLTAILAGHTTMKAVGFVLDMNWRTVQTHLHSLFQKTGTRNCTALVLWAWHNGWQLNRINGVDEKAPAHEYRTSVS
jgi:DNA-binding NarL/FixJ family response regulator